MAEIDRAYMQLKMRLQQDRHPEGTLLAELDAFKSKVDASLAAAEAEQVNRDVELMELGNKLVELQVLHGKLNTHCDGLMLRVRDLEARAVKAEGERDHWKANHDRMREMKRAIQDRPDLKERAALVQKLIAQRDAAIARAEGLAEALRFYADEYTYVASCATVDGGIPIEMPNALIDQDQGKRALAALSTPPAPTPE